MCPGFQLATAAAMLPLMAEAFVVFHEVAVARTEGDNLSQYGTGKP